MRIVRISAVVLFIISIVICSTAHFVEKSREDPTIPVISSTLETLELPCAYQKEDLLRGLQAEDEIEGSLTDEIVVGNISRFQEPGCCNVTYVVFDSYNNPAILTRPLVFTDYRSPRFTLTQPLVFNRGADAHAVKFVGAEDLLDGDITPMIQQISSDVNYMAEGSYTLELEVSNSFGDLVEQKLPVHIVEPDDNQIKIELKQPIVYLRPGDRFDPAAYIASISDRDQELEAEEVLTIDSGVRHAVRGCYEVRYSAEYKEKYGVTWLTVIVK